MIYSTSAVRHRDLNGSTGLPRQHHLYGKCPNLVESQYGDEVKGQVRGQFVVDLDLHYSPYFQTGNDLLVARPLLQDVN